MHPRDHRRRANRPHRRQRSARRLGGLDGKIPAPGNFRRLRDRRRGRLARSAQAGRCPTGQFYAPDPTERTASIGGTIATNASGSRSFRYGSTRRHVLGLRVALHGRPRSQRSARRQGRFPGARKSRCRNTTKNTAGYLLSPGMDWIDLFTGSEGTLGIVLEAELQLLPRPADVLAGVVFFPGDELLSMPWMPGALSSACACSNISTAIRSRFCASNIPKFPRTRGAALLIEQEKGDIDFWAEHAPEDSWFADTRSGSRAFPPLSSRAAGAGERHRAPPRVS